MVKNNGLFIVPINTSVALPKLSESFVKEIKNNKAYIRQLAKAQRDLISNFQQGLSSLIAYSPHVRG